MPLSRRYTPEWAPGEAGTIGMDYSYVVPPGVPIVLASLSFWTNTASPIDVSGDFVISAAGVQIEGRVVFCLLRGGSEGRDYQVRWNAFDNIGNAWPRTALMLCAQTS